MINPYEALRIEITRYIQSNKKLTLAGVIKAIEEVKIDYPAYNVDKQVALKLAKLVFNKKPIKSNPSTLNYANKEKPVEVVETVEEETVSDEPEPILDTGYGTE